MVASDKGTLAGTGQARANLTDADKAEAHSGKAKTAARMKQNSKLVRPNVYVGKFKTSSA